MLNATYATVIPDDILNGAYSIVIPDDMLNEANSTVIIIIIMNLYSAGSISQNAHRCCSACVVTFI